MSPGVAVGALCVFFYNQLTIKYLDERKEWLVGLQAERREWSDSLDKLIDRYDTRLVENVSSLRDAAAQDHALRGRLQEFMTNLDNRLRSIENLLATRDSRTRGGNGDD